MTEEKTIVELQSDYKKIREIIYDLIDKHNSINNIDNYYIKKAAIDKTQETQYIQEMSPKCVKSVNNLFELYKGDEKVPIEKDGETYYYAELDKSKPTGCKGKGVISSPSTFLHKSEKGFMKNIDKPEIPDLDNMNTIEDINNLIDNISFFENDKKSFEEMKKLYFSDIQGKYKDTINNYITVFKESIKSLLESKGLQTNKDKIISICTDDKIILYFLFLKHKINKYNLFEHFSSLEKEMEILNKIEAANITEEIIKDIDKQLKQLIPNNNIIEEISKISFEFSKGIYLNTILDDYITSLDQIASVFSEEDYKKYSEILWEIDKLSYLIYLFPYGGNNPKISTEIDEIMKMLNEEKFEDNTLYLPFADYNNTISKKYKKDKEYIYNYIIHYLSRLNINIVDSPYVVVFEDQKVNSSTNLGTIQYNDPTKKKFNYDLFRTSFYKEEISPLFFLYYFKLQLLHCGVQYIYYKYGSSTKASTQDSSSSSVRASTQSNQSLSAQDSSNKPYSQSLSSQSLSSQSLSSRLSSSREYDNNSSTRLSSSREYDNNSSTISGRLYGKDSSSLSGRLYNQDPSSLYQRYTNKPSYFSSYNSLNSISDSSSNHSSSGYKNIQLMKGLPRINKNNSSKIPSKLYPSIKDDVIINAIDKKTDGKPNDITRKILINDELNSKIDELSNEFNKNNKINSIFHKQDNKKFEEFTKAFKESSEVESEIEDLDKNLKVNEHIIKELNKQLNDNKLSRIVDENDERIKKQIEYSKRMKEEKTLQDLILSKKRELKLTKLMEKENHDKQVRLLKEQHQRERDEKDNQINLLENAIRNTIGNYTGNESNKEMKKRLERLEDLHGKLKISQNKSLKIQKKKEKNDTINGPNIVKVTKKKTQKKSKKNNIKSS